MEDYASGLLGLLLFLLLLLLFPAPLGAFSVTLMGD